jgi:hypothetical protein
MSWLFTVSVSAKRVKFGHRLTETREEMGRCGAAGGANPEALGRVLRRLTPRLFK